MLGIEQVGVNAGVFERLERGLPVDPGAFHRGGGDAVRPEPVGHRPQTVGQRTELAHGRARQSAACLAQAHRGGDAHLVDVEAARPGADHVHLVDVQGVGVDPLGQHQVPSWKAEAGSRARLQETPASRRGSICCSSTA